MDGSIITVASNSIGEITSGYSFNVDVSVMSTLHDTFMHVS